MALCRLEPAARPCRRTWSQAYVAFGVSASWREEIVRRAAERDIAISTYKEDRPAEDADNCYLHDPDGNRVQLVVTGTLPMTRGLRSIDHVAIQAIDLEWEEDLYVRSLGLPVEHITGWRTSDYKRARLWGEGKEDMAPGTRRWDGDRFGYVPGKVPGQTPLIHCAIRTCNCSLKAGAQAFRHVSGLPSLTHYQQPPEKQVTGVPRVRVYGRAFSVAAAFDGDRGTVFTQAKSADGRTGAAPGNVAVCRIVVRKRLRRELSREFCTDPRRRTPHEHADADGRSAALRALLARRTRSPLETRAATHARGRRRRHRRAEQYRTLDGLSSQRPVADARRRRRRRRHRGTSSRSTAR